jgi:hypothetical protein
MTKDEALKLALEALERYSGVDQRVCDAEDALRTAIEAAEKMEPRCAVIVEVFGKDWRLDYMSLPVGKHKLYTQQYIYTTPPQRTWVGLTEDEIVLVIAECAASHKHMDIHLSRAIEAKLKEKNA